MLDITPLLRLFSNVRLPQLAHEDPVKEQQRQLAGLLRRAAATKFGRDHDFAGIRDVAEYQARVPLRHYDDLWREYWQGAYPILDDVSWPGRIPYFAFTSGTTSGSSKFIPVSRAMVAADRRAALDALVHHLAARPHSHVLAGKTFMLGGSTDLTAEADGVLRGDLSGIAANEVPAWVRPWASPPTELALDADWNHKIGKLARLAITQDIRSISGTPSWVLALLDRMSRYADRPPADVLPNLELYVHGGISFAPYRRRFHDLLPHAETREVYPASEGFVAIADRGPDDGLRLLVDNGLFFEFVPVDDLSSATPDRHWLGNARIGADYAIVLTTCAGLWSYVLGDVVRLVSLHPPRLMVIGRVAHMLNAFGEHLSGEQIEQAVMEAAGPAQVVEYTAGALMPEQGHKGRHVFVVEFGGKAPAAFAERLDRALIAGSVDYAERRAHGIGLEPPMVAAVPPGFFTAWMERRGKLGGQNKVPRVVSDSAALEELLDLAGIKSPSEPERAP